MNEPFFQDWLEYEPYGFQMKQKHEIFMSAMCQLTEWHFLNCSEYKKVLKTLDMDCKKCERLSDIPFLPVRLFKEFNLKSISNENIFKTLTSSGTSGQQVSKIYLDRETASLQSKVLSRLMRELLGPKRLPMLVIDSPDTTKNRDFFSARAAGIRGFSMFGVDVTYALDNNMELDMNAIESFLSSHPRNPIFVFGFTFIVWKYFALELKNRKITLNLNNGILLHGGGWKKLESQSVCNKEFSSTLKSVCSLSRVVNYYGMVEQTGSIFMECKAGYLHTNIFADLIIRHHDGFEEASFGEEGIVEVLSILPKSYPGHSLLTEDIGVVLGEDDCTCGLPGKYFNINGRIPEAEIRGCSDTHEP